MIKRSYREQIEDRAIMDLYRRFLEIMREQSAKDDSDGVFYSMPQSYLETVKQALERQRRGCLKAALVALGEYRDTFAESMERYILRAGMEGKNDA